MSYLARQDDLWTSHAAAERIAPQIGTSQARVLWLFQQEQPEMTDEELIRRYRSRAMAGHWRNASESRIRTARKELVDLGWLTNTGRTRTNEWGNEMHVWSLTNNGA